MKRRQFLQGLGVLAMAGVLPKAHTNRVVQNGMSVLVIGAGMSGLGAARRLANNGYSVTVLEGRDRIGGRTWTDTALGVPLDMGASWIHHIEGNPVWEIVQELGIETKITDYDNVVLYEPDGEIWDDDEVNQLDEWVEELSVRAEAIGEDSDTDLSIGEAVRRVLAEEDLDEDERRTIMFALNSLIEQEYAADLDDLSLWYFDEGSGFGGDDVLFPDGYVQIVNALAADLDIRLSHIVQQVSYSESGVRVLTNQGEFSADYAVVTLPLGVLKNGSVSFNPPLPESKQAAINRMDMGVLNKCYLRFPTVFWDDDVEGIGYVSENKGEWSSWVNMDYYLDEPILLCFNAGRFGMALENLSDAEIVAEAMKPLRAIYGDDTPDPIGYSITRWHSDPFAQGSYSYVPVGATPDDYDALAAPVADRLFFAGEATNREYSATVHGALMSGRRAAAEVMED